MKKMKEIIVKFRQVIQQSSKKNRLHSKKTMINTLKFSWMEEFDNV